ncbi:hypothetical protein [uncultured Alsobacter sp.]|uniref:hypothetical protein n=1 Tax=uncultured Alsobacter sp. TaxID=1748258 RepID=UPI0025F36F25|nr:hypothetical protein [uncultured Alsobacter sp.]
MASKGGVRGAGELANAFRMIGKAPTAAARRQARQAALEPIRQAAADHLVLNDSIVTGALRASLAIGEDVRKNTSILGQRKGTVRGQNPSATAHLVEFSVRPHYQPNRFGGIMHPGHPGYPFMRPAYEQKLNVAGQTYLREMAAVIETMARSVPKPSRSRS